MKNMLPSIVPILCFLTICLDFRLFITKSWRSSILFAALVFGILVTIFTEILSLFKLLVFWPVLFCWSTFLLLSLIIICLGRKRFSRQSLLPDFHPTLFQFTLLTGMLIIILLICIIAWVAPPNTWDSMTYHMSRVMHWIQDQRVSFYPTPDLRQLHSNPWAEFAILQFQILNSNDRMANLIQFFSMIGSILGVSLIARELKASTRGQIFSAIACAALPMGILQASSTQTDYGIAFWLVCFIYFMLRFFRENELIYASAMGAALGLGILTKATMYIFCLPFGVWLVIGIIQKKDIKLFLLTIFSLIVAFTLNSGQYFRNISFFGNILGQMSESPGFEYANGIFTLSSGLSNIIRNIGIHLGTPFGSINNLIEDVIVRLHQLIGVSLNDPRTTWPGTQFTTPQFSFHEDYAGNLVPLFFILLSLISFACLKWKNMEPGIYAACTIIAFLFLCVYLRWQPWNSRLQLPLFVIFSPFVGLVFSQHEHNWIPEASMACLLLASFPWVLFNQSRPLVGENSIFTKSRISQYFNNRPYFQDNYENAAKALLDLQCGYIGLAIGGDDWEYPLWVLLNDRSSSAIKLEHINVTNDSNSFDGEVFPRGKTCAIFSIGRNPLTMTVAGNNEFKRIWSSGSIGVYTRIQE